MTTPDPLREAAAAIMREGVSVLDVQLRLHKETPANEIKWRQGPGGKELAYVDARYVMDTLDEAVGPDNWKRLHAMEGSKVACGIAVRIDGEWIEKWDGAGETDIEGEKGSFSDSFKRAAVNWGIARDLYSKDAPAASAPQRTAAPRPAPHSLHDDYDPAEDGASDGGSCPAGHGPWVLKPGGVSKKTGNPYDPFYACQYKPARGEAYCNEKPSKAWLARQETN